MRRHADTPSFVGLMFLHCNSSYQSYVDFVTEVQSALDSTVAGTELRLTHKVVIRSDKERGLIKALCDVSAHSTHLQFIAT